MKTVERLLAEKLLKISAIKLQPENPFVWASGWNSPIYTDNLHDDRRGRARTESDNDIT